MHKQSFSKHRSLIETEPWGEEQDSVFQPSLSMTRKNSLVSNNSSAGGFGGVSFADFASRIAYGQKGSAQRRESIRDNDDSSSSTCMGGNSSLQSRRSSVVSLRDSSGSSLLGLSSAILALKCGKFEGTWRLPKLSPKSVRQNKEDLKKLETMLSALKISPIKRKIVSKMNPRITFQITYEGFIFTSKSSIRNFTNTYKWDVPSTDTDPFLTGNNQEGQMVWSVEKKEIMCGCFTYRNGREVYIKRQIGKDGNLLQIVRFEKIELATVFDRC